MNIQIMLDFWIVSHSMNIWAYSIAKTRTFNFVSGGLALVPFIELFNHRSSYNQIIWAFNSNGSLIITTRKDIHSNEELFFSYGSRLNNEQLLLHFGFVSERNVRYYDKYDTRAKISYFNTGFKNVSNVTFVVGLLDHYKEMFKFWRKILYNKSSEINGEIYQEMKVLKIIGKYARIALNEFDTSFESDQQLLLSNMDLNMRNIVLARIEEKEIFHFFSELEKKIVPLLNITSLAELKIILKTHSFYAGEVRKAPLLVYIKSCIVSMIVRYDRKKRSKK